MVYLRADDTGDFNPRSPCGERQQDVLVGGYLLYISIHAPRVGSDSTHGGRTPAQRHFNPRSPCGERQQNCTNTS